MSQHFICYSDEKVPFTGRPVPYNDQDATRHWASHYAKSLELRFYLSTPASTFQEKARARVEMVVCDRKMEHWRRHPNFDVGRAAELRAAADREWRQ